jgi:adenine deaminase
MTAELEPYEYPQEVRETVHVSDARLAPEAFRIAAPMAEGSVIARVIEVQENHVETNELLLPVTVRGGEVVLDGTGLCKLAVFERHGKTGEHAVGLLSGVTFTRPAAIAMTVAHDSHNLLVLGNDDKLLAHAAQAVRTMEGGVAVATERGVTRLPLPIAGLMSDAPFEVVVAQGEAVSQALRESGCMLNHALMTLSLLALVVIPTLRLSDKGLVKVTEQGFVKVPLFVEE